MCHDNRFIILGISTCLSDLSALITILFEQIICYVSHIQVLYIFSQSRVWLLFGSILWSSVLSNYPYLLCSVRTQGAVAPSSCQLPAAGVSSHDVSVTLMSASIHVLIYFDWDYSSKVEVLRFRWCWSYITKEILLLFEKKEILLMLLTLSVVMVQYHNPFF